MSKDERRSGTAPPSRVTSMTGPLEEVDGRLLLQIPLRLGGDQLIACSRGISQVIDEFLIVEVLPWLAESLRIRAGSIVAVDNENGKFNVHPHADAGDVDGPIAEADAG